MVPGFVQPLRSLFDFGGKRGSPFQLPSDSLGLVVWEPQKRHTLTHTFNPEATPVVRAAGAGGFQLVAPRIRGGVLLENRSEDRDGSLSK